ncbi:MAG: uridine monophosphate kinase [Clostridia bacterium]|nr:uridine monophosphate kinase [Clostridia bacterium]
MKRILLKLSGEALSNGSGSLYDHSFVDEVAKTLCEATREGYQLAVVVGAGNIWRGRAGGGMDRTDADRMGMLATVINAICLKDAIIRAGVGAAVMTAVPMSPFAEPYSAEAAKAHLEAGRIVVLGAGLGIPFLSTDTTGAVRAAEMGCDAMLMAKNIDYIYTADPRVDPTAEKLEEVAASTVLALNLKAIDATATAFCLSTGMPIRVFGLKDPEDILKAVRGETLGTVVTPE